MLNSALACLAFACLASACPPLGDALTDALTGALSGPLFAEEVQSAAEDTPSSAQPSSAELAEQILSCFDTVIEHHIDPPTRDSLVLAICKFLDAGQRSQLGLGRAISAAGPHQMASIIEGQLDLISPSSRQASMISAIGRALDSQAMARIVKASDQRVNEQLAANRYVGIGIAIGFKDSVPSMMNIFEDGPADKAGAKKGDRILKVDGVNTSGEKMEAVINMLRGPSGTTVSILLESPDGSSRTLKMTRDVVPIKHVEDFTVVRPGIASVRITSITGSIVRDLRKLTPQMQENEIKGLVIQLDSPTVSHRPALMFANALIDGGTVGGLEDRNGIHPVMADAGRLWPGVELAIALRGSPQDSLAWAIDALIQQRNAYVHGISSKQRLHRVYHAWKYSPVPVPLEMGGQKWEVVMPVARLLKTNKTSGKSVEFATMADDRFGANAGRVTPQMSRRSEQGKEIAALEHKAIQLQAAGGVSPLDRCVSVLRMRLGQPN